MNARLRIKLLDKLPQDYLVLFVFGALQNKIFAPNQFARAHKKYLYAGITLLRARATISVSFGHQK